MVSGSTATRHEPPGNIMRHIAPLCASRVGGNAEPHP